MSAWGMLLAMSGFRYDAVEQALTLAPQVTADGPMRCFFSAGAAWGVFDYDAAGLTLHVREGTLTLRRIQTPAGSIDLGGAPVEVHAGQCWSGGLEQVMARG